MTRFIDGVLVVDKPSGPTSHDVVARVRRVLGIRRIGHTGTLDPLATGVLPLVIGRATRLASLLTAGEKSYDAAVRLGRSTETYDGSELEAAGDAPPPAPEISRSQIERALEEFRGTYMQAPPRYSAKKIGGIAAHRLARRRIVAQPAPVSVTVSELALLDVQEGLVRLSVTASAGFYVRSLAHDLGDRLGCGAYLEALRRTRAAGFTLADSVPLDAIESHRGNTDETPTSPGIDVEARVIPLGELLLDLPAVILTPSGARRVAHGNDVPPSDFMPQAAVSPPLSTPGGGVSSAFPPWLRLLDESGRLLGIARAGLEGTLRPAIVLV